MRYVRGVRRSRVASAALVVVMDVVLIVVAVTTYLGGGTTSTATLSSSRSGSSRVEPVTHKGEASHGATKGAISHGSSPAYRPLRVVPPQTAVESTVNQSLAASSSQGAVSELEKAVFPVPATSPPFHAIDGEDSASATLFSVAFTQELLDIDFATSTRRQLLAWANYNNAPYSLGGLPGSLSSKVLALSLTTGPSSVPSATAWKALAKSRTSWSVSGLVVSVNPTWTQALSAGWEPVDPLMVIYDVSGNLTVTTPGHASLVESIGFALSLGGASLHAGYGAVALDDWTVN